MPNIWLSNIVLNHAQCIIIVHVQMTLALWSSDFHTDHDGRGTFKPSTDFPHPQGYFYLKTKKKTKYLSFYIDAVKEWRYFVDLFE